MKPDRWQQITSLYRSALEQPADRRTAFIAQATENDPELRHEVESRLLLDAPLEIGQYRIESKLGEGGMGQVYKAWDTKLNRPVAIKFLSETLTDAAGRRRFQREAQFVSSLNHPHILTIYDAGELNDRQYLVTEFVDGGTLKDWAAAQQRTWNESIELLAGVADGLGTAHAAGILHRDIKPANVLVSTTGYAKLADFGLAKLAENSDVDLTRTLSEGRTRPGMIVGTIPYMSPEQASGRAMDARSDIFSFGVVLYELLAGQRPFRGSTDLEVLRTIIDAPAPPMPDRIPPAVQSTVEKALAKDPAVRYQSARQLAADLRQLTRAGLAPSAKRGRSGYWTWAAAAVLAIAFGTWQFLRPPAELPNPLADAQFTRLTDFEGTESNPAISPDGRFVTFVSDRDGTSEIWLSQTRTGSSANFSQGKLGDIRGPLRSIGFNGDGSEIWIAGIEGRRLQLLPLVGGTPRNFLDETAAEIAFSPDGSRVVFHKFDAGDPVFTADRNGTNIVPLVPTAPAGIHQHFQVWSQDGRWIYFVRGRPATREMDLWRVPSTGGQAEQLTQLNGDIAFPTPLDAQTIAYIGRDNTGAGPWLWAFDLNSRATRRISTGLEQYTAIAATTDGKRLAASVVTSQSSLWTVPILDRIATEQDVRAYPLPTSRASAPRFGGTSLFYLSSRSGADGLWVSAGAQTSEIWSGTQGALSVPAAISRDGRTAAIAVRRENRTLWHSIAADGTQLRVLSDQIDARGTASWSPDGQWLVTGGSDSSGPGLFKIPVNGGPAVRLAAEAALDPVWSPKGDLIVYGGTQVFTNLPLLGVRPDGTRVNLPSINVRREGERMRFTPDGSALIYMQNPAFSQDFWTLDLTTMQSRQLTKLSGGATMRTFDVTPDGKSIIFDRVRESSDIVLIDRE